MKNRLHTTLLATAFCLGGIHATAQTVSTFEDVTLPGADTTYLETQIPNGDGVYTFQTGNALFYGNISWGSYWGNFNCSNYGDTTGAGLGDKHNVTGAGYDGSSQFGIAFVPTDFMSTTNPTATIPVGTKLLGAAAGNYVLGTYVTNALYTYRYMKNNDHYADNQFWLKMIVRGYLNGAQTTDSVNFTLADYSIATPVLVDTWTWIDLTPLGKVDSVTFDLVSNDTAGGFGINTPAYFAIDNFTTSDDLCPIPKNIAAVSINENSATISWDNGFAGFTTNYEVAVDESATLAPTATATLVTTPSYNADPLNSNTLYYVHVRAACEDGSFSAWDTASFKTLGGTDIVSHTNNLAITVSPNPATTVLNLNTTVPVNASVFCIEGKLMLSVVNTKQLDIAALPAGMYLLKVSDASGKYSGTLRFVKQN